MGWGAVQLLCQHLCVSVLSLKEQEALLEAEGTLKAVKSLLELFPIWCLENQDVVPSEGQEQREASVLSQRGVLSVPSPLSPADPVTVTTQSRLCKCDTIMSFR